jgi:hypothetical protein
MLEDLVPMVIMTGMFAMIFGIAYIRSRENMAMIEKGLNPRMNSGGPRPFVYLKYGLLLVGAGIGLLTAYFIDRSYPYMAHTPSGQLYYKNNPAIYFALIAVGGGLGLVVSFLIEKKYWLDKKREE